MSRTRRPDLLIIAMTIVAVFGVGHPFARAQVAETMLDFDVLKASDFTPQPEEEPLQGRTRLSIPATTSTNLPVTEVPPPDVDMTRMEDMEAFLEVHPDHADVLTAYGRRLFEQGDLANALDAFERVYNLGDTPWSANNYAALLAVDGQHEEALGLLNQVLYRYPTYGRARFNLACVYHFMGRDEEAMQQLLMLEKLGWRPLRVQLADPDLDPLRDRQDFIDLERRLNTMAQ
jgi:tetratricopeptide (TPR) repeat protein